MWDKYLLPKHGICKSWRRFQHSHWSSNSVLLLLHLKYLKIILFETMLPLWSWFSTKSPFTTNLVHKQTVIKLSVLACYSGNGGNWQPSRSLDVGVSSLSVYTLMHKHTHMRVCVYENPNICICQYFLNRMYHLPNISHGEPSRIIKIFLFLCWLHTPSNLSCPFLLSMLDHTALRQYKKWYANCKDFWKLLHIYSLKYKDFISWIAFYQLYFMALAVLFLFC